jgi:hypothetical protein
LLDRPLDSHNIVQLGVTIQIVSPIGTDRAQEQGKLFVHVRPACVSRDKAGPKPERNGAVAAGAVSGASDRKLRAAPINLPGRSMTFSC